MEQIILYHGSPNQQVSPQYGLGDENMTMGKDFILPRTLNLRKNGRFADRMSGVVGFINLAWI